MFVEDTLDQSRDARADRTARVRAADSGRLATDAIGQPVRDGRARSVSRTAAAAAGCRCGLLSRRRRRVDAMHDVARHVARRLRAARQRIAILEVVFRRHAGRPAAVCDRNRRHRGARRAAAECWWRASGVGCGGRRDTDGPATHREPGAVSRSLRARRRDDRRGRDEPRDSAPCDPWL